MRSRNRLYTATILFAALAASVLLAGTSQATPENIIWKNFPCTFDTTNAVLDKKFIGDENDTIRTRSIDLRDVAWDLTMQTTPATIQGVGDVEFFSTSTGSNANTATDTLSYAWEWSPDGTNWSYVVKPAATAYNSATAIGDATGKVFKGYIGTDTDGVTTSTALQFAQYARLKIWGDADGASAKLAAVKVRVRLPVRLR